MPLKAAFTTAGANWIAQKCIDADSRKIQYIGAGTDGSSPADEGDTALAAEVGTRVAATLTNPASRFLQLAATVTPASQTTYEEVGMFTDQAGGVMPMRATFDPITIPAGGDLDVTLLLEIVAPNV